MDAMAGFEEALKAIGCLLLSAGIAIGIVIAVIVSIAAR